jgi:uncharacterized protein YecE (DUF72 family)
LKKDVPRLRAFLGLLPLDIRAAIEFREASWFADEVYELLRERGVALCIAEADEGPEVPFVATANWGYLRLRRADYTDDELHTWKQRALQQTWQDAFIFFKHEDEGKGPLLARRFLDLGF